MAGKGRPYRTYPVDRFEILVGRGASENDILSFEVAEPDDFWLHAAGYAGSHVVIRNPDLLAVPPPAILQQAARLAAWHSKARGSRGKVEVHWCRVADVRKPGGMPDGKVVLKKWETIRVYPILPDLEET
jgi:predicted ribosome quality control (RQC) complex YloA/Tae2 family protein